MGVCVGGGGWGFGGQGVDGWLAGWVEGLQKHRLYALTKERLLLICHKGSCPGGRSNFTAGLPRGATQGQLAQQACPAGPAHRRHTWPSAFCISTTLSSGTASNTLGT